LTAFPHLLSPLQVAGQTLPNRMVMGAMHTRLETMDHPIERLAAFYATRAKGEIGLILTGGHAPVPEGVMDEGGLVFNQPDQVGKHQAITHAVRNAGGRIVLQILHAGRYAKVADCVSPSPGKARINAFSPRPLSTEEVWHTIEAFASTAALAEAAGYAGVEIMGSEGYLINEFTSPLTNLRNDAFGGDFERRIRMPVEVVGAVRRRVSREFMVIYRISAMDLMVDGLTASETAILARRIEAAGADLLNTGIGWHEAAVPTMAAAVPRAAWTAAVRNIKSAVSIPVMASNRINTPEVAEDIIASGAADLVSMARPLLADPQFARKTREGRTDEIMPCIACNQACLDHIFTERVATCLVNPRACREPDFEDRPASQSKHIAVVGGGPAGMAFAVNAAHRGHRVTLFEAEAELGGQLRLAREVPGKSEFHELLRYFRVALARAGVTVKLGQAVDAQALAQSCRSAEFQEVVLATGVQPRRPDIRGFDHPKVLGYQEVLSGNKLPGAKVAIIGAGGIGFDVADYLVGRPETSRQPEAFMDAWGVDIANQRPGALCPAVRHAPTRHVFMFQRGPGVMGKALGKSTGWILKAQLKRAQVEMTAGVSYTVVNDQGLHYSVDGQAHIAEVDHVVICAGQTSRCELHSELAALGIQAHLIGGARAATELDALRAIDEATRLAMSI